MSDAPDGLVLALRRPEHSSMEHWWNISLDRVGSSETPARLEPTRRRSSAGRAHHS